MSIQTAAVTLIILSVGGYLAYDAYKQSSLAPNPNTSSHAPLFPSYALPHVDQRVIPVTTGAQIGTPELTYIDPNDHLKHSFKDVPTFSFVPVSVFRRNPRLFDIDSPYTGPVP